MSLQPNDVDCVLLIEESARMNQDIILDILDGLPFLDVQVVKKEAYDYLIETMYATDRWQAAKGVVEVLL